MRLGWLTRVGNVLATPIPAPAKAIKRGAEKTMQAAIAGVIRHVLTTLGGGLIANGVISSDELSQAIGAIITLVGTAWSIISKQKRAPG